MVGDGEHIADAMTLYQPPGLLAVQPLAAQQDGYRPPGNLAEGMNTGAVRQRGNHQRGILLGGAGHEVA